MFPNDLKIADHFNDIVRYHGLANTSSPRMASPMLRRVPMRQELALSRRFMLPSAHFEGVGLRIDSLRSWIRTPGQPWFSKTLM
jgi:hypothetical protein